MPWFARAWLIGAIIAMGALVVVLMVTAGWFPALFALFIGIPAFLYGRSRAKREMR